MGSLRAHSYELDSAGNPKADFGWIGSTLKCGYTPGAQTDPNFPQFGSGCDAAGSPLQVAANWGFKDITLSTGLSAQVNLSAAASYLVNYHFGSHFGILEFGGKIRNGHKFQDATETVYDSWKTANYPMTMFLSGFSSNNYMNNEYFGGHYGPVSDFTQLKAYTQANLASYLDGYKTAADGAPNQFDILERISAAYIMNTMDFGRLHVVAGVRFEGHADEHERKLRHPVSSRKLELRQPHRLRRSHPGTNQSFLCRPAPQCFVALYPRQRFGFAACLWPGRISS